MGNNPHLMTREQMERVILVEKGSVMWPPAIPSNTAPQESTRIITRVEDLPSEIEIARFVGDDAVIAQAQDKLTAEIARLTAQLQGANPGASGETPAAQPAPSGLTGASEPTTEKSAETPAGSGTGTDVPPTDVEKPISRQNVTELKATAAKEGVNIDGLPDERRPLKEAIEMHRAKAGGS
jgi:hypothetical protein